MLTTAGLWRQRQTQRRCFRSPFPKLAWRNGIDRGGKSDVPSARNRRTACTPHALVIVAFQCNSPVQRLNKRMAELRRVENRPGFRDQELFTRAKVSKNAWRFTPGLIGYADIRRIPWTRYVSNLVPALGQLFANPHRD